MPLKIIDLIKDKISILLCSSCLIYQRDPVDLEN